MKNKNKKIVFYLSLILFILIIYPKLPEEKRVRAQGFDISGGIYVQLEITPGDFRPVLYHYPDQHKKGRPYVYPVGSIKDLTTGSVGVVTKPLVGPNGPTGFRYTYTIMDPKLDDIPTFLNPGNDPSKTGLDKNGNTIIYTIPYIGTDGKPVLTGLKYDLKVDQFVFPDDIIVNLLPGAPVRGPDGKTVGIFVGTTPDSGLYKEMYTIKDDYYHSITIGNSRWLKPGEIFPWLPMPRSWRGNPRLEQAYRDSLTKINDSTQGVVMPISDFYGKDGAFANMSDYIKNGPVVIGAGPRIDRPNLTGNNSDTFIVEQIDKGPTILPVIDPKYFNEMAIAHKNPTNHVIGISVGGMCLPSGKCLIVSAVPDSIYIPQDSVKWRWGLYLSAAEETPKDPPSNAQITEPITPPIIGNPQNPGTDPGGPATPAVPGTTPITPTIPTFPTSPTFPSVPNIPTPGGGASVPNIPTPGGAPGGSPIIPGAPGGAPGGAPIIPGAPGGF